MNQSPPAYPGDAKGYPQGYGVDGQYPPAYSNYGDPSSTYNAPPPGYGYPPPIGVYPPSGPVCSAPGYAYPPPTGPYPTGQTSVIIAQPGVNLVQTFRDQPVRMLCPFCQADVVTATECESGAFTWLICVLLCFVIGIFGLIPFCVDGCKDVVHHCPSCKQQVGRYSRM